MLGKLRLLAGISGFVIVSAFLSAGMEHFYAILDYTYKLREDWSWVRAEGGILDLFPLGLMLYGFASVLFYLIFLLPVSFRTKLRGPGRIIILSALLLLELGLILGTTQGVASAFTTLALTHYIIYLLPVLLLNLFLGRNRSDPGRVARG